MSASILLEILRGLSPWEGNPVLKTICGEEEMEFDTSSSNLLEFSRGLSPREGNAAVDCLHLVPVA